jgi:hypothetical protein
MISGVGKAVPEEDLVSTHQWNIGLFDVLSS